MSDCKKKEDVFSIFLLVHITEKVRVLVATGYGSVVVGRRLEPWWSCRGWTVGPSDVEDTTLPQQTTVSCWHRICTGGVNLEKVSMTPVDSCRGLTG